MTTQVESGRMSAIQQMTDQGQVSFAIRGDFDSGAAQLVRERILTLAGRTRAVVDLSHVMSVQDSALAILAQVIRKIGSSRIAIRGLGDHQRRILRYMGVELNQAPSPAPAAEPAAAI